MYEIILMWTVLDISMYYLQIWLTLLIFVTSKWSSKRSSISISYFLNSVCCCQKIPEPIIYAVNKYGIVPNFENS